MSVNEEGSVPPNDCETDARVADAPGRSGIHSINIHNFKSWGGTHCIGPLHTFTCIVGSNGSGKSNLMDAISFVLGVRTQQLRGQHARDLIHRLPDPDAEPLPKAYVELVYDHGDGNRTVFRKAVYRAQGKAQYYIDGKPVTWKAYEARLRDFGVIVRARNFLVFQGDVESVAQKSPKQLTELFEQISGSASLREEYEKLLEASKEAEALFLRSFEKKKSVLKEKKQIKEQKDEAERFQTMQREYKEMQTQFFLWQLFHIDQELTDAESSVQECREESEAKAVTSAETEEQMKDLTKQIAAIRRQRTSSEKALSKITRKIDSQKMNAIKLKEQASHLRKGLSKSEDKYENANVAEAENAKLIDVLKSDLATVQELMDTFESGMNDGEDEELQVEESQLQEYNKCKEKASQKTASLKQDRDRLAGELRLAQTACEELENQTQNLDVHKQQLLESLAGEEERIEEMKTNVKTLRSKRDSLQRDLSAIEKELQDNQDSRSEIQEKLAHVEKEMMAYRVERSESDRESKLNEALVAMQRLYPGVKGKLSTLCRPTQRRYNSAVAIALGKNLNGIVVDSNRTALECIRYLKEKRVGTATFLPLDNLRLAPASELPDAYRQFGGKVKLVRDVIEADESMLQAVLFACGNTLVAETMQDARRIAFEVPGGRRVKVVTLEGDLLHKSGNMSGGAKKENKDSGSTWDRQKMAQVKATRDELVKELASLPAINTLRSRQQSQQSQLVGLQNRLRYAEQDLKVALEKLPKLKKGIAEVENDLKKALPDLQTQKANLSRLETRVASIEKKIAKQEDAVFNAFSRSVGVSSIREYEEKRLQASKQRSERRLDLSNQISRLNNQIQYQSKKNASKKLAQLEKKIAEDRSTMKQTEDEYKNAERAIQGLQDEADKLKAKATQDKQESEALVKEVRSLKETISKQQDELSHCQSRIAALESEAEKLRLRRKDLLQSCRLDQVDIPTMNGRKKRRGSRARQDSDDEEMDDENDAMDVDEGERHNEDVPIEVDYSALHHNTEVEDEEDFRVQKQAMQDELARVAADLDAQTPNLKAMQRFAEVTERMKSTMGVFDSARSAAKESSAAFSRVRQRRLDKFMTAFNHVSDTIDKVYKDLTQSQDFPLGGNAFLSLENPDDPFEGGIKFSAMPPMKRFRDMEQLSGGEKTVAALALLFSIHSFHPSPYFVMDEIDAALDKSNVTKVARYIRSRAHNDGLQFVVISLKDTFFDKADALIGVYKDRATDCSGSVNIDLTKYD